MHKTWTALLGAMIGSTLYTVAWASSVPSLPPLPGQQNEAATAAPAIPPVTAAAVPPAPNAASTTTPPGTPALPVPTAPVAPTTPSLPSATQAPAAGKKDGKPDAAKPKTTMEESVREELKHYREQSKALYEGLSTGAKDALKRRRELRKKTRDEASAKPCKEVSPSVSGE